MRRLSFRQRPLVGLAVLPENIQLVQLKRTRNSICLQRALSVAVPPGVVVDGRVGEFAVLQTVLAKLVCKEGLHAMQVATSVPVSWVKMQRMLIPAGMPSAEIEAEVLAEASRLLSIKNEKITLDYYVRRTGRLDEQAVTFAAARDHYHERYALCLREAGLLPAIIEVDICALLRGARFALKAGMGDHEKMAVLSLHNGYGVIAADHAGELLFHQHWDERQTITLVQWLEWCCQAYSQAGIGVLALTGCKEYLSQAISIVSRHWSCKVYEIDPFAMMKNSANILPGNPSGFLLACGLALRESLPWLK